MPIGPTWFAPSSKRERNECMSSTEVRGRWSGTCGHWDCVPILIRHSNPKIHTNFRYFYESDSEKSQIPPDFVVKAQVVDIVEVVAQLLSRSDVVQTSCGHRKSRYERLSP